MKSESGTYSVKRLNSGRLIPQLYNNEIIYYCFASSLTCRQSFCLQRNHLELKEIYFLLITSLLDFFRPAFPPIDFPHPMHLHISDPNQLTYTQHPHKLSARIGYTGKVGKEVLFENLPLKKSFFLDLAFNNKQLGNN